MAEEIIHTATEMLDNIFRYCRKDLCRVEASYATAEKKLDLRVSEEEDGDNWKRLEDYSRTFHKASSMERKLEGLFRRAGVILSEAEHADSVPKRIFLTYNSKTGQADLSAHYRP